MTRSAFILGILLIATVAVSGLFLTGATSVSSTEAERGLTGTVADDSTAYIGVNISTAESNDTVTTEVEITNNGPDATVTRVAVYNTDGAQLGETSRERVEYRDSVGVETDAATCGETVIIGVEGDGFSTSLDRDIEC